MFFPWTLSPPLRAAVHGAHHGGGGGKPDVFRGGGPSEAFPTHDGAGGRHPLGSISSPSLDTGSGARGQPPPPPPTHTPPVFTIVGSWGACRSARSITHRPLNSSVAQIVGPPVWTCLPASHADHPWQPERGALPVCVPHRCVQPTQGCHQSDLSYLCCGTGRADPGLSPVGLILPLLWYRACRPRAVTSQTYPTSAVVPGVPTQGCHQSDLSYLCCGTGRADPGLSPVRLILPLLWYQACRPRAVTSQTYPTSAVVLGAPRRRPEHSPQGSQGQTGPNTFPWEAVFMGELVQCSTRGGGC